MAGFIEALKFLLYFEHTEQEAIEKGVAREEFFSN